MNLEFPIIRTINKTSVTKLIEILNKENFYIINLDGDSIKDEETFFQTIAHSLPLNPPLSGEVHYDAFSDSLWGGLGELPSEKFGIIWSNFDKMLVEGLNDFIKISQCLIEIAQDLTNTEYGIEKPTKLRIFLVGEGCNFIKLGDD